MKNIEQNVDMFKGKFDMVTQNFLFYCSSSAFDIKNFTVKREFEYSMNLGGLNKIRFEKNLHNCKIL